MTTTQTATRDGDTIVVFGLTHDGFRRRVPEGRGVTIPAMTADHRWVVVCAAGMWVWVWAQAGVGQYEFREFPGSVTFHRAYRSEAAAHAEAATVARGRVISVESR